jgi:fatty-acyl-CoA synthase
MSSDLTVRPFLERATELFPDTEIVSRTHDGIHRYTYEDVGRRVPALAAGLAELGVENGDRVGTLAWNHHRHYEAYFAVPLMGAQLHTINVQLPDDHVEFIVNDAEDDVLLVDPSMFDTVERLWDDLDSVEEVVVMGEEVPESDLDAVAFEDLVAAHEGTDYEWPDVDEDQPAGMCYTSGTTGMPKGCEYTHRMYYLHAMMVTTPAALDISESDAVMPVVPMFHVNAWEFPYAATMAGAKLVLSGPAPSTGDRVDLIEGEEVSLAAGVPTVWIDALDHVEGEPDALSSLERLIVGGSAAPEEMMRRYEEDYDVVVDHAWGMTETMSIGSVSRPTGKMADWSREERFAQRKKQGLLSPGLEMCVRDEDGNEVPWDGESFGELHVRGPTVISEYYNRPEANEEDFDGEWLKTGDIVSVDEHGYLEVVDRTKDVIKSGGEWISSIELENALMAHDAVLEATVIAVPHDRWQERPLACVRTKEGSDATAEDLRSFLEAEYDFPGWWLPDDVSFEEDIPKTATGKFDKKALRSRHDDTDLRWTPSGG